MSSSDVKANHQTLPELCSVSGSAAATPENSGHGSQQAKQLICPSSIKEKLALEHSPSFHPPLPSTQTAPTAAAWKQTPRLMLSLIIAASCVAMAEQQVASAKASGNVDTQHILFDSALCCYLAGHLHRGAATATQMARHKNWENKTITTANDIVLAAGSGLFFTNNLMNTMNAEKSAQTTAGLSLIVPLCFGVASLSGMALVHSKKLREKKAATFLPLASAGTGAMMFAYVHPNPIVKACAASIVVTCAAGMMIRANDLRGTSDAGKEDGITDNIHHTLPQVREEPNSERWRSSSPRVHGASNMMSIV